jgi:hypothetical protein
MTPHAEWLRQCELFSVLKGLSFFKQWRIRTVRASTLFGCSIDCFLSARKLPQVAVSNLRVASCCPAVGTLGVLVQYLSSYQFWLACVLN